MIKIYVNIKGGQEPSSIEVNSTGSLGELKNAIAVANGLEGVVLSLAQGEPYPFLDWGTVIA